MAFSLSDICSKNLTKSHRHPYGIRSGGERNPIGRRTESDWTANASGEKNLRGSVDRTILQFSLHYLLSGKRTIDIC